MAAEVVKNDDVTRVQLRDEELLDVSAEDDPVDRAIDDARRGQRIGFESSKEGERAPAAVRSEPF